MTDVLALLDAGKLARRAEEERGSPLRLSAFGHCAVKLAKLLEGVEPRLVTGARGLRIFDRGTARGKDLAIDLEAGLRASLEPPDAIRTEHEVFLEVAGQRILGHTDFAAFWNDETFGDVRRVLLVDFKVRNDFGWERIAAGEGVGEDYEAQLLAYMAALAEEFAVNPSAIEAWLIPENADDCRHHAVRVPWNQERFEWYRSNFASVIFAQKDRVPVSPPIWIKGGVKPNGSLPWQCNYCEIGPDRCGAWGAVKSKSAGPDKPPAWSLA